jgi:hypothetical protein
MGDGRSIADKCTDRSEQRRRIPTGGAKPPTKNPAVFVLVFFKRFSLFFSGTRIR